MRYATTLMLSDDGCATDNFPNDDYRFDVGEPYGANPFMRLNGGLSDVDLETAKGAAAVPSALALADTLALNPDDLAAVEGSARVSCGVAGVECDYDAEEQTTSILHRPTGILLSQQTTFDDQITIMFQVDAITFGVDDLPEQLR